VTKLELERAAKEKMNAFMRLAKAEETVDTSRARAHTHTHTHTHRGREGLKLLVYAALSY
jgi:hypothetical protein